MTFVPLIFLFYSPQLSPEPYQLEELNPFMLYTSSTYEHRSLIVYGELKNRPIIRLFLYDFNNNHGFFIEDGRLDGFRPLFIVANSNGWFLWEASSFRPPRVAHLKHDGKFINFISLEKITGWQKDFSVRSVYGHKKKHTLLTLEKLAMDSQNKPKTMLATLDMETLQLNTILTLSETVPCLRWVPFADKDFFLQIDTLNGSILLTDTQAKVLKTLKKRSCGSQQN